MQSLVFDCLWGREAESDVAGVKRMWREYGAIGGEEMIEGRARQIVFAVKDQEGRVGGVSTARPLRVKLLNDHWFYEFRCFIAPPFRAPGLDTMLAVKTKSFLETLGESGEKFKGMVMVIEHSELKKQRTKAVWPGSEMVFVGYTREGHHFRVGYFRGVKI